MWLYHKPKSYVVPECIYTLVKACKSTDNKIYHRDQYQVKECDQQTEKTEKSKPYSNKELADIFYYVLFLVFTALYLLLILYFSVSMSKSNE